MSSESNFAASLKYNTHFRVKNTCTDRKKTIMIFHYPINWGTERDLLQIPGVQESDIRASLLKGELRHKFLCGDIELVSSNIDLLQFSDKQRAWLYSYGFYEGVAIGCDELDDTAYACIDGYISAHHPPGSLNYAWREKIALIGMKDGTNRIFYTPDKFINGSYFTNIFHITVEHNGKELYENIDFTIAESSGPGTGYDTINIYSFTPNSHSILFATYAIKV